MSWSDHQTWNLVLPPSRPGEEDLNIVRSVLATLDRSMPICVMGSTPEFRDLAYFLGFRIIVVVDTSVSFYEMASSQTAFDKDEREDFVQEDWRSFFARWNGHFGAILSDLTMGNIPYEDRRSLYRDIQCSLAPGGYFIDKVLTREATLVDHETLRNMFDFVPINWITVNRLNCLGLFCMPAPNGLIDAGQKYDEIIHRHAGHHSLVELANRCQKVTPRGMKWYYGHEWQLIQTDYSIRGWTQVRIPQHQSSAYFGYAYIFVSRKEN